MYWSFFYPSHQLDLIEIVLQKTFFNHFQVILGLLPNWKRFLSLGEIMSVIGCTWPASVFRFKVPPMLAKESIKGRTKSFPAEDCLKRHVCPLSICCCSTWFPFFGPDFVASERSRVGISLRHVEVLQYDPALQQTQCGPRQTKTVTFTSFFCFKQIIFKDKAHAA